MNSSPKNINITEFNISTVIKALSIVEQFYKMNIGGEVVEERKGEYKSWDPEIIRIDKEIENMYIEQIRSLGLPVVLLSEEVERLEINTDISGEKMFAVSDPFDGSYLFKRGIPDFWYSSLAFYDEDFRQKSSVVGDSINKKIAFSDENNSYICNVENGRIVSKIQLNRDYRQKMGRKEVFELKDSSIESYAMKPKKFLLPLVDKYRNLIKEFKFFLPNGGPYGFVDVAEGKIDVYFAPAQPFVDVFSGIHIAQNAGVIVTDFKGNPLQFSDNVRSVFDVVVSTNKILHDKVLNLINT